jgi:hypothetical protein
MRSALGLLVIGSFALAGCDSSVDDGDTCASIGLTDVGAVTATTPTGEFRSSCASITGDNDLLVAIVREPGSGALGGETIELYIGGTTPGTYDIGDDTVSGAAYGPSPSATVGAASGSITVTSSDDGIEGTFEFVTATGAEVTGGRFDLNL